MIRRRQERRPQLAQLDGPPVAMPDPRWVLDCKAKAPPGYYDQLRAAQEDKLARLTARIESGELKGRALDRAFDRAARLRAELAKVSEG